MLLRRALRRAGAVRRCRQKSSSPKEDPFHNRATAMNFEEGEGWLQRLVGTTGRTTTEFERYKAAAEGIDMLPRVGRDNTVPRLDAPEARARKLLPDVSLEELLLSMAEVLRRAEERRPRG